MNPPKSHWSLVYYQHKEIGHVVVTEGECDALTDNGYAVIGRHMYTEPLMRSDPQMRTQYVVGTRYVFALEAARGTGHYDVTHNSSEGEVTLFPEIDTVADYETTDADRDADARRAQAADERYADRMRYGR